MSEIFVKLRIKELLKGNMKRYLLFGFVEIFLVVAGILIALAINNWNIRKTERNDEVHIYTALKERIQEDKRVILDDADYNNTYLVQFRYADRIIADNNRAFMDTLAQIIPNMFKYSDFDRSNAIYQNLVNSGELKILKNSEITYRLQILEESYMYINRMENIHLDFILEVVSKDLLDNVDFSTGDPAYPEVIFNFRFHNRVVLLISIMEEKNEVYQYTIQQIDQLTEIIDQELAK